MIWNSHYQKERQQQEQRPALRLPLTPPTQPRSPNDNGYKNPVIEIDLNEGNIGSRVISLVDDEA